MTRQWLWLRSACSRILVCLLVLTLLVFAEAFPCQAATIRTSSLDSWQTDEFHAFWQTPSSEIAAQIIPDSTSWTITSIKSGLLLACLTATKPDWQVVLTTTNTVPYRVPLPIVGAVNSSQIAVSGEMFWAFTSTFAPSSFANETLSWTLGGSPEKEMEPLNPVLPTSFKEVRSLGELPDFSAAIWRAMLTESSLLR